MHACMRACMHVCLATPAALCYYTLVIIIIIIIIIVTIIIIMLIIIIIIMIMCIYIYIFVWPRRAIALKRPRRLPACGHAAASNESALTIIYYTILHYTTILYYITLCSTRLYYSILYCNIPAGSQADSCAERLAARRGRFPKFHRVFGAETLAH